MVLIIIKFIIIEDFIISKVLVIIDNFSIKYIIVGIIIS